MNSSIPLVGLSVLCGVGGQLALKIGMGQVGRVSPRALGHPVSLVLRVITDPVVGIGLLLYMLGAAAWLAVLSRVPLSLASPLLALSYVLAPIFAWLILRENVSALRWLGILIISLGVFVVARS